MAATPSTRKPAPRLARSHMNWTHEHRLCLYLLRANQAELDWSKIRRLFNSMFEAEVLESGFPDGLSDTQVQSQYSMHRDHRSEPAWERHWRAICHPRTTEEQDQHNRMYGRILSAMALDGVDGDEVIHVATPVRPLSQLPTPNSTPRALQTSSTAPKTSLVVRTRSAVEPRTPEDTDGAMSDDSTPELRKSKRARRLTRRLDEEDLPLPRDTSRSRQLASPRSPQTIAKHSPVSRPISQARTQLLPRRNMEPIPVTPEKYRLAQAPWRTLSEEEMHPPLPQYVFRTFTARNQGLNSPAGFVCGMFADARVEPPGPPLHPDMNDVLEHLNPSKAHVRCSECAKGLDKCCKKTPKHGKPSRYISVSSDLIWVARKLIADGEKYGHISVIDTSKLDRSSVFYVPPFQQELARKHLFRGREFRYKGYSEHLVWNEIPGSAMVKTFSFQQFVAFSESDGTLRDTLRLPNLRTLGTSSTEIVTAMKQNNVQNDVQIEPDVAASIAKIVMFLGVGSEAPMENIAFLVCEIVRGWGLQFTNIEAAHWQKNRDAFMDGLYRGSDRVLTSGEQQKLKYAFNEGVRRSCIDVRTRTDWNADARREMENRAKRLGVPHPKMSAADEVCAIMQAASSYDPNCGPPLQRLLQSISVEDPRIANATRELEFEQEAGRGLGEDGGELELEQSVSDLEGSAMALDDWVDVQEQDGDDGQGYGSPSRGFQLDSDEDDIMYESDG